MTIDSRTLIAEGRKHDAAMTEGPWTHRQMSHDNGLIACDEVHDSTGKTIAYDSDGSSADFEERNAAGVAWLRTNLAALLDGYASALDEVNALRSRLITLEAMKESFDRAAIENTEDDPTELAHRVLDQIQSQPYAIVYALAKQIIRDHQHRLTLLTELTNLRASLAEQAAAHSPTEGVTCTTKTITP